MISQIYMWNEFFLFSYPTLKRDVSCTELPLYIYIWQIFSQNYWVQLNSQLIIYICPCIYEYSIYTDHITFQFYNKQIYKIRSTKIRRSLPTEQLIPFFSSLLWAVTHHSCIDIVVKRNTQLVQRTINFNLDT